MATKVSRPISPAAKQNLIDAQAGKKPSMSSSKSGPKVREALEDVKIKALRDAAREKATKSLKRK